MSMNKLDLFRLMASAQAFKAERIAERERLREQAERLKTEHDEQADGSPPSLRARP